MQNIDFYLCHVKLQNNQMMIANDFDDMNI